jgi:hypothetical protein
MEPPWRQPRGKSMVSLVNSHTNATRIGWHLWEIDLRFALDSNSRWENVYLFSPQHLETPPFFGRGALRRGSLHRGSLASSSRRLPPPLLFTPKSPHVKRGEGERR